ncbi:MAG: glycosyltransferase [Cyanobacteria bacterium P01_D01_bin.56]
MHEQVLQVFPSVLRQADGELLVDTDWLDALRVYAKNFEKVVLACPVTTDDYHFGLRRCYPIKKLSDERRIEFLPLPEAFKLKDFIKNYSFVRDLLRQKIKESKYLEFSPHTLVGDWAAVACLEAIKQQRSYVISADVVYHKVAKLSYSNKPFVKRLVKDSVSLPLMKRYHRHLFKQSLMALIQGQDTYDEYSPFCEKANLIYHVTVTAEEKITPAQLDQKVTSVLSQDMPLKICYAGRVNQIKGPADWIKAVNVLVQSGISVQATWIGDGPLLSDMQELVKDLKITDSVSFPGYVSNREKLFDLVRDAHIFLFCHKTPESPRCLIEAVAMGCPIVGYESAYPLGLIEPCGGGQFVEVGNWSKLAETVAALNTNREGLATLIQQAAKTGQTFDKVKAYQHRIDLIRESYGVA